MEMRIIGKLQKKKLKKLGEELVLKAYLKVKRESPATTGRVLYE